METLGAIGEGEWNSFNGMCSEEADFMAQLLGNCSLPNEVPSNCYYPTSSTYWSGQESNVNVVGFYDSSVYSSDETSISTYSFPQGSSNGGGSGVFPESYYPNMSHQFFVSNNNSMTVEYRNNAIKGDDFLNQDTSNDSIESNGISAEGFLKGNGLQLGREFETPVPEIMEEKASSPSEMSKKRLRIPEDVQRSKRSMKLKKILKVDDDDENNNNKKNKAVCHRQNLNSCSEDDSKASHELNGVVSGSSGGLNSNGKTRACRGSATDPQSLYARKRRERINERLKVLQSLVPNGTKVDISTMLEEAVQYVKFLQLQIKLLSSDEHWMYSPIAYNGMDLGLDLRIPTPNSQP